MADALRPIEITRNFTKHAEGSVLMACGDTKVLCTASIEEKVPPFLRGAGKGWVTAEYSMLPSRVTDYPVLFRFCAGSAEHRLPPDKRR